MESETLPGVGEFREVRENIAMQCIHEWEAQGWSMGICTGQELSRYVRILYYKQETGSGLDDI